ncbi:hypothetical protein MKW94_004127 [Papaver nudicaule]|uniref:Uncharacterized protein n=1 Tax=Papaver nudicaule TaxID=74823 RepID=A0AA41VK72_PAPNU|nr:hypothetical protein [Papaver nudicaule]
MANRLRGFTKMLSTAKNSTRKEGFCRMYSSSSDAENGPGSDYLRSYMKEIYGDIDYRTLTYAQRDKIIQKHVNKELYIEAAKGLAVVAVFGVAFNYAVKWWFEKDKQRRESHCIHCGSPRS